MLLVDIWLRRLLLLLLRRRRIRIELAVRIALGLPVVSRIHGRVELEALESSEE
jgi:hypothetical protein